MGWTERVTGQMTQREFIHGGAATQEITLNSSDPWTNAHISPPSTRVRIQERIQEHHPETHA